MGRTEEWFEERVGVSGLAETGNELLSKRVPSHINYAFTLGTAAITLFMTQVGSGILLALNYTASMEGAHESVWRITHEISSGWLIRSGANGSARWFRRLPTPSRSPSTRW